MSGVIHNILSVHTHSIPKNVNYGTHKERSHPVESNGSVTVPVQSMLTLSLLNTVKTDNQ